MQYIPGLQIITEYIDKTEEHSLIARIDRQPWLSDMQRRVQHYGFRYDYKRHSIDLSMHLGNLPAWSQPLAESLHDNGFIAEVPDQLIVNEYLPGQGISPHVDCEPCFGETIISLSLGSSCVMELSHLHSNTKMLFFLRRRSLLVLSGEARYDWKHGIPPRKSDVIDGRIIPRQRRISMTFRNVILEETPVIEDHSRQRIPG